MNNFFKNIAKFFEIILLDFLKPLTINLYEVILNIVFTVATAILNLAFEILYILNPSFYEPTEPKEQITDKKIGFRK